MSSSPSGNPSHTYEKDGQYQVNLQVTSVEGCVKAVHKLVTVHPLPVVSFEAPAVCFGSTTPFKNNSAIASGNLRYVWNFGDNSETTHIHPDHAFAAPGTYQVNLTATSGFGCVSDQRQVVAVYEQPVALFEVDDTCLDAPARFVNSSTGSNLSYSWQFGDGSSSAGASPTHQYATAGFYTVDLFIASAGGCTAEASKVLVVAPLPTTNFVTNDVCVDQSAEFTNLSTIASGSISYNWAFGDGTTSGEPNPRHLFETAGIYTTTLTATSDKGCTTLLEKAIEIFPLPAPAFSAGPVCDGSPSQFVNGTTLSSGSLATYLWVFGDQTSSIEKNPLKQYLNPGTYLASLKATSEVGCEALLQKEVTVYDFPVANFTVANVCFGFAIEPANLSEITSGELSYFWDFGDGHTSASANPVHTYEAPGTYAITLRATSGNGCADQIERPVTVYKLPPAYAGEDTTVSKGYPVQLFGSGGTQYTWSPLAGLSNSHTGAPVATPLETTDYEVLVTDQFGCQNTDTVRVTVKDDFKIVATNVFTPDDNGQNDTWVISNVETFGDVNVRVFDRYGTVVFQETAYENTWRGTRGNDILPDGTYFYVITFSASEQKYQGALTIIRNGTGR